MTTFFDNFRASILLLLISGLMLTYCSTTNQTNQSLDSDTKTVVGEVAGEEVTLTELKRNYQSSNPVQNLNEDDLADFLPVYLNYRAKLEEAEQAGYYDNPEIQKEYNNYAEQAAYSYWMEEVVKDSLLDDFYRRSKQEVKVSHILRRVTPQASPSDTAEAYRKLMEAREKYLSGASFDSLMNTYSTKRNGRPMGGEIGYFTAGNTIEPFEDASYSLPVDSVSMPVRSKYGYHLILVKDKRKRHKDRKVSHIFFSTRGSQQVDTARALAQQAYGALQSGMEWDAAVSEYSQDRGSKRKGGSIGWINYGRLDESFVDSVMSTDSAAAYTKPIRSNYGFHILKIDSIRTFPTKQAELDHLMDRLKNTPRYKNRKEVVHKQIAKLGNAKIHSSNLTAMVSHLNNQDTATINKTMLPDSLTDQTAYTINGQDYTVGQFYSWLQDNHGSMPAKRYRAKWFDDYKLTATTDHLIPLTEKRFPEFNDKIKNYMDGLVVFQITQDSVWQYAETDTAQLRQIYKANPDSFRYDKRYHYYMFTGNADSLLLKAVSDFENGMQPDTIDKKIKGVAIRTDSTSYVDEFPFSKLRDMNPGSLSNLLKYKDRKAYLYLEEILDPRRMTFDEAYNRLVSFYQPVREKNWIESLRKRHNVKLYPDRLASELAKNKQ